MSYTNPGPAVTTGSTVGGLNSPDTMGASPDSLISFHGATPIAQQTVTGARDDGTALASLLTALANLGLIVDDSTAT